MIPCLHLHWWKRTLSVPFRISIIPLIEWLTWWILKWVLWHLHHYNGLWLCLIRLVLMHLLLILVMLIHLWPSSMIHLLLSSLQVIFTLWFQIHWIIKLFRNRWFHFWRRWIFIVSSLFTAFFICAIFSNWLEFEIRKTCFFRFLDRFYFLDLMFLMCFLLLVSGNFLKVTRPIQPLKFHWVFRLLLLLWDNLQFEEVVNLHVNFCYVDWLGLWYVN